MGTPPLCVLKPPPFPYPISPPILETQKRISFAGADPLALFGRNDRHLDLIGKTCGVDLVARGEFLHMKGQAEAVRHATALLTHLVERLRQEPQISEEELKALIGQDNFAGLADVDNIVTTYKTTVKARTPGQINYLRSIVQHDVVFGIGPAGTGKTYLAVAAAVAALRQKLAARIVLARPAVEAGESLGFLPGALEDKVDPYLRPLYDALQDLLEPDRLRRLQDMKIIEVVPLAYMRGRTLNDAFIILDEAQNTTPHQMKMFLTRLGNGSQAVVTGDITQIDLPQDQPSGLVEVQYILKEVDGLAFVYLDKRDIMRNPLVQTIIQAYDTHGPPTPDPSAN